MCAVSVRPTKVVPVMVGWPVAGLLPGGRSVSTMVTVTMPTEIPEYSVAPVTECDSVAESVTESGSFIAVTFTRFGLDQSVGVKVTLDGSRVTFPTPEETFTDTVTFAEGGVFRTTV